MGGQDDVEMGCCRGSGGEGRLEALIDLERADCNIELARIRVADSNVKIARAANYIKVTKNFSNTQQNFQLELF